MPVFPTDPEADRHIAGIEDEVDDGEHLPNGEPGEVVELEDGSAVVIDPSPVPEAASPFHENLATKLPDSVLGSLSTRYLELVEMDRDARKRRVDQYEEGIRRSGLAGDAPGGASFDGASRAVHPVLVEAAIDFQSTAMRELYPPTGPVRTKIRVVKNKEDTLKAERKAKFLNWMLTSYIEEHRTQKEQLLAQLPFGGSQYMKWYPDPVLGRPACEFVRLDDMLLPFSASSFYTASRQTHVLHLTQDEFEARIESGLYREVPSQPPSQEPDATSLEETQRKVEGKELPAVNEDGMREDYEIHTWLSLKDDSLTRGRRAPYVITISKHDQYVLALYRNWEENDPKFKKLDWFVAWPFIPWDGVYDLGLFHLIGGLATAATGTLRSLLDSALVNNMPGGLRLKGSKISGQTLSPDPTNFTEVEGGIAVDDIRKIAMPFPFNPTSPVLFQLLGWLTDAAKGVITTAEEKIQDASNQMPVGTALALIEQGAKVMSSIHSRLHAAQEKEFKILCRIINKGYTDEELAAAYGEPLVSHGEFAATDDIEPVSDPNIFSEGQRYAQIQAAMQMSADPRVQYNAYELHRMTLERMKFPEIDRILPKPPVPTELNSVAENIAVVAGKPLAAFPDQDHLAHIEVHLRFAMEPVISGDRVAVMRVFPPILEHVRQHILFFYGRLMHKAVSFASGADLDELLGQSVETYKMLDAAFAAASDKVSAELGMALSDTGILQLLGQMFNTVQTLLPQVPQDPAMASVQAALKETERRANRDQQEMMLAMRESVEESRRKGAELEQSIREANESFNIERERLQKEQMELMAQINKEREQLNLDKRQSVVDMMDKVIDIQTRLQSAEEGAFKLRDEALSKQGEAFARVVDGFQSRLDALEQSGKMQADGHAQQLKAMVDAFAALTQTMSAPKEAVLSNGRRVRIGPAAKENPNQEGEVR